VLAPVRAEIEVRTIHRHPWIALWLHDDAELAATLGSPIVERATIHEWPLFCVQRLRTADGRAHIYKAQTAPTVEPLFYTSARSPLLVGVRVLDGVGGGPAALLLEEVAAPRLIDLHPAEEEAVRLAREVLGRIARIEGDLPTLADIGTETEWVAYANAMLADLAALVAAGTFRQVDRPLIARLARRAEAPAVLAAIRSEPGYLHGDLTGDNLLVVPDGYRVIDWQRPLRGPAALDLANLLESLGVAPRRHVEGGVVQLLYLLRIAWFAQAARRWFPPGAATYDTQIARLAARVEEAGR
jgi:hypothetical protein